MNYEQPNKDNVKTGDLLVSEINNDLFLIPIKKVKELGVNTIDYPIPGDSSITCHCPYKRAIIIKEKGKKILMGNGVKSSLLEKFKREYL